MFGRGRNVLHSDERTIRLANIAVLISKLLRTLKHGTPYGRRFREREARSVFDKLLNKITAWFQHGFVQEMEPLLVARPTPKVRRRFALPEGFD